ncbi:MAG: hypothetical protein U0W40_15935 [Acidimicrobiia bacterium]
MVAITVIALLGAATISASARDASAAPTSPPPSGVQVLTAGQVPGQCTDVDYAAGAYNSASNYGTYWSELSHQWLSAPWCYPRWGLIQMTPSQVVQAGATVSMAVVPDDARLGAVIGAHGGMTWRYPGTVVAGCGFFDMSCTVTVGDAASPPPEWAWSSSR